jgi:hypothetical protein
METILDGFNKVASSNIDWSLTAGPIWLASLGAIAAVALVIGMVNEALNGR